MKYKIHKSGVCFAFTLAEVLITLVIIGVIAAMTVPTLMASSKKSEYTARLKKFYSVMSSAVRLSEIEEGVKADEWDYTLTSEDFFKRYLSKYLKFNLNESKTTTDEYHAERYLVYFDDGTYMSNAINENYYLIGFDVNGDKKPNINGRDQFYFSLCNRHYDDATDFTCAEGRRGLTFGVMRDIDVSNRRALVNDCKSFVYTCSWLLLQDGWEFKDDYPHKI